MERLSFKETVKIVLFEPVKQLISRFKSSKTTKNLPIISFGCFELFDRSWRRNTVEYTVVVKVKSITNIKGVDVDTIRI